MKQKLKKFLHKAGSFLGWKKREEVIISGLMDDEKMFMESMQEKAQGILQSVRKFSKEAESINIHVKTAVKPKTRIYELQATVYLPGHQFKANANSHELHLALSELGEELKKEARKQKDYTTTMRKRK
ncbi:hypothetical protein HUU53_04210 [Candidatus Micrarchaeota archaeon]|nr:hypothetical protein [Candidatus Micrarchaeota archaeon]